MSRTCVCKGCKKKVPSSRYSGMRVGYCRECWIKGHELARGQIQRLMHNYEWPRKHLVRKCAICGHLLNIELIENKIPEEVGYFGRSPMELFPAFPYITPIEREYWECALCMKK